MIVLLPMKLNSLFHISKLVDDCKVYTYLLLQPEIVNTSIGERISGLPVSIRKLGRIETISVAFAEANIKSDKIRSFFMMD